MDRFVELTTGGDEKVFVNLSLVRTVSRPAGGANLTRLWFGSDDYVSVMEDPQEIVLMHRQPPK